jgi:hypothetical protein
MSSLQLDKPKCPVCFDLDFKTARQYRINFECTLDQLIETASSDPKCRICLMLLSGVNSTKSLWPTGNLQRVQVFGRAVDDDLGEPSGLFAEVYTPNEGPKFKIEFFKPPGSVLQRHGHD